MTNDQIGPDRTESDRIGPDRTESDLISDRIGANAIHSYIHISKKIFCYRIGPYLKPDQSKCDRIGLQRKHSPVGINQNRIA